MKDLDLERRDFLQKFYNNIHRNENVLLFPLNRFLEQELENKIDIKIEDLNRASDSIKKIYQKELFNFFEQKGLKKISERFNIFDLNDDKNYKFKENQIKKFSPTKRSKTF